MIDYVNDVIVPYVSGVRGRLGLGDDQAALAIFDHFKGQLTPIIMELLESHNIQSVLAPPGCTDRVQPLDVSVNRAAKAFLSAKFQNWYANEMTAQLHSGCTVDSLEPVDFSFARMKCLGAQWLVDLMDHLSATPDIIVHGFITSGITPSIDADKPVTPVDDTNTDEEETDEEIDEEETDEEIDE